MGTRAAVANRASGCAARTRALAVPTQPQGGPHYRPSTRRRPARARNPAPRLKPETPRRLHQPSPGGRTLTWSPGTRWAAAKSLEESPPWRGWRKTPEAIATSGVDSPWTRGCCKTLPAPAVQLERCQNRGDLRQGRGKAPTPTRTSKAENLEREAKASCLLGRKKVPSSFGGDLPVERDGAILWTL